MPEPDIFFLTISFDAVAVEVQFAPSLVFEIVLQDVRDGAFFLVVFTIGISLGDVDLYVVAQLVGVASWLGHVLYQYSVFCVVSFYRYRTSV